MATDRVETVRRLADAVNRADKKAAFASMTKWYGISDPEKLEAVYAEATKLPSKPYPSIEGLKAMQSIYTWRKHFGGLRGERRRLRRLEAENARLKKLVAERGLEIEVMKEVAACMVRPVRARFLDVTTMTVA